MRIEKRSVCRTNHHVGLVDEVERTGGAYALHRAYHRLPHLLPLRAEQLARVFVVPDAVRLSVAGLYVETGAECTVARGAQHDGIDRVIEFDCPPSPLHLLAHGAVERVE